MSRTPEGAFRASFRDPDGVLIATDDRIVRAVRPAARDTLDSFLTSDFGRQLVGSGRFVATKRLDGPPPEFASSPLGEAETTWYEHERIAIPTYAYEWSPRMLHAAAALTLRLAKDGAGHGFSLKDATPDNILFRGAHPVFVDALSFERRDPHDPTWLPYAQFVRTFLLPLLANREFGLALDQALLMRREGLEPDQVYRWCRWSQRLRPPFLSLVTLPTLLTGRAERTPTLYQKRRLKDAGKAQFILQGVFAQLRRALHAVTPASRSSAWSHYEAQHDPDYIARKTDAVATALKRWPRTLVLDIGCNTGQFSLLAARTGAKVVAVDADSVVVDTLWERAHQEGLDIQTLVGNLAQPSPATGWMNRERPSLLDRLRGRFDAVFALAVLHHFLATERVPLRDVVDLLATLTTDLVVVEFVAPTDELFQRLSRGRDALYQELTPDRFERDARVRFDVVERVTLMEGRRWLYVLRARGSRPC